MENYFFFFAKKKQQPYKPDSVFDISSKFCHLSGVFITKYFYRPTLRVGRAILKPRFTWSCNP